jgi:hypothetical protein
MVDADIERVARALCSFHGEEPETWRAREAEARAAYAAALPRRANVVSMDAGRAPPEPRPKFRTTPVGEDRHLLEVYRVVPGALLVAAYALLGSDDEE